MLPMAAVFRCRVVVIRKDRLVREMIRRERGAPRPWTRSRKPSPWHTHCQISLRFVSTPTFHQYFRLYRLRPPVSCFNPRPAMKPGDSEMARLLVGQGGQTAVGAADGEGDDPDGEDDSADDQKDGDAPTRPGRRGQACLSQPGQPARGAKATRQPPHPSPPMANASSPTRSWSKA